MASSDALLGRLRTLHPLVVDLSLGRIETLLAKLGNPHQHLPPTIHVAGTNGKGSTCAYLRAMLEAAGHRVSVFTSPHLVRFHERIVLPSGAGNSRAIADDYLVDCLARAEAANAGAPMTFFEITTAAAFIAFAETPADALVLEVGMGGRLDATNVVRRPAVCAITPIAMDHMNFLGDTIELIAAEKAGILKPGIACTVAHQTDEAGSVIRAQARRVRAPLFEAGQHFDAFEQNGRLVFQEEDALMDLPLPALIGRHQIDNAGLAIATIHRLRSVTAVPDDAIARGLTQVAWPARMQRLRSGRLMERLGPTGELWIDGGHNPSAGGVIASVMADLEERRSKPLVIILGMLKLKDTAGFLDPFGGIAQHVITVTIPGDPQSRAADDLAAQARRLGFLAVAADGLIAALDRARELHSNHAFRVLICGSLHLAGAALALNEGLQPYRN